MYAQELTNDDIGHDLTITVDGILTGGIIRSVSWVMGMVSVDLDGQRFVLPADKPVELLQVSAAALRALILTEPDLPTRHALLESGFAAA